MNYLTPNQHPQIYLLSDTHYIAEDLHDNSSAFIRMQETAAGKDLKYQKLALTAFGRKIIHAQPAAVIITGDLTFNGAKISAQELANIFNPIIQNGISFLVLPGNHDIYDGWARKFSDNKEYRVDQISPQDWKEIFNSSYKLAASHDESSLAYSINLNPNYRLIFADSNIYQNQYSYTYPITNGKIFPEQLTWIEHELKIAQENHQHVLFFMHHNLYPHNNVIQGGFVLDNAQELQNLFKKYQVKVAFSGHIHAQNIATSRSCPTIEVAQSCFSMTDQGYGVIDLSPNQLSYQRKSFTPNPYLTQEEFAQLPEKDFHHYLSNLFTNTNNSQMTWLQEKISNRQTQNEILSLINQLNWNFFVGKSQYSKQEKDKITNSMPYKLIKEKLPQLSSYVESLISCERDSLKLNLKF